MKKSILIAIFIGLTTWLGATEPVLQLWHGSMLRYEQAIDKVDSITFPLRQVSFWRNGVAATLPLEDEDQLNYSYADFYDSFHQNPDYLYDIDSVAEIIISVTRANWNTYLANFDANPNNGYYVPASFKYKKNGRVFTRDSVGLRPRGNTSRVRPQDYEGKWHHAHFGIKFTEYATGERFFGSDRIILKWFKEDSAYVRDVFCYDLMRRFGVWSAPRSCYVRLSIQVEGDPHSVYMGVYEMIENPRKGYLKARKDAGYLPDNDGNMWKGQFAKVTFSDPNAPMGIDSDDGLPSTSYPYALKLKKENFAAAKAELQSFISDIAPIPSRSAQLKTWLEAHMDVDLFLRAQAVECMVGHWDNYWSNANNLYFYFDLNHKFYYIPFDMDNTLGTGQEFFGNPGTKNMLYWGSREGDRMLARKVFSIPEYEERFKTYLRQLATDNNLMQPDAAIERVRYFQSLISSYVVNDTGEDCYIYDAPASWGSYWGYRLLCGSIGDGQSGEANFFRTKANSVP